MEHSWDRETHAGKGYQFADTATIGHAKRSRSTYCRMRVPW
jgi:hypothetical protein